MIGSRAVFSASTAWVNCPTAAFVCLRSTRRCPLTRSAGPITGASRIPPASMNSGLMPIRLHAAISTNASNTPMWFAVISSGLPRRWAGIPPVIVSRPTRFTRPRSMVSMVRQMAGARRRESSWCSPNMVQSMS